jgi:hypothetical protein
MAFHAIENGESAMQKPSQAEWADASLGDTRLKRQFFGYRPSKARVSVN